MEYTAMDQYWIWLASVDGLSPKRFYQLLSEYEDARSVWDNVGPQMEFLGEKAYSNLRAARDERYFYGLFSAFERLDIAVLSRINDAYPPLLSDIFDPPPVLYVKGNLDFAGERALSVVGTRTPTMDGRRAAEEIAEGLAQQDVCVVSGLARGIDTCAHRGALKGKGKTVAVLGCGVDVVYPPENDKLAAQILDTGGALISEYMPGTRPLPQHFPARNRIISGLSRGVLIVEAAKGSGAMITVDDALEQNRDVFVVPGSIYSALSAEPNRLLLEGALPVLSSWDILEHYRWAERPSVGVKQPAVLLSPEEAEVVEPLRSESLSFDELAGKTGFPSAKLNSLLTTLELRGIIVKAPGGLYRARV